MVRHAVRPRTLLHDKVAEEGPLSAAEVASIGAALSEGLVAVHEAGVVHRDLKPSNILLSPKGPRIIDFGIAWATGASTLTHVGTAVGSPGFLAPEQVRGAAVTPRRTCSRSAPRWRTRRWPTRLSGTAVPR